MKKVKKEMLIQKILHNQETEMTQTLGVIGRWRLYRLRHLLFLFHFMERTEGVRSSPRNAGLHIVISLYIAKIC